MFEEYKIFARKVSFIAILNILMSLSAIIILPIITKNYSVEDYGIWVQITVTLSLLPNFVTLGLPYAMNRFLASAKDKERVKNGFYFLFYPIIFVSFLCSFVLFLLSSSIATFLFDNNIEIALILPIIVFFACINLLNLNFFITFQKTKIYALFTFIQTYLSFGLIAFFAFFQYSIFYVAIGLLITQITLFIIVFPFIVHIIGFKLPNFKKEKEFNIKEYLSFSLPTTAANLAWWVVESGDRYIIGIILGTSFVGYYSPGYTLSNIIRMISFPLVLLLTPVLSKYYDENKNTNISILLRYSLKYFLVLSIPAFFGLSILSKFMLTILTTSEIASNGFLITPFIALTAIFYGMYTIFSQILVLEKKTKITGLIWLLSAFLNVVLNILFIPYFGIIGAAVITLFTYGSSFFLTLYYSSRYFTINFDLAVICKSIFASIIISLIIVYFYPSTILDLFVITIACIIIYLVILLLLKVFKKEEIRFFASIFKN